VPNSLAAKAELFVLVDDLESKALPFGDRTRQADVLVLRAGHTHRPAD